VKAKTHQKAAILSIIAITMKKIFHLAAAFLLPLTAWSQKKADVPTYPRSLRELNVDYFPMTTQVAEPAEWPQKQAEIGDRILLASGLLPLPEKTPLNAVIHGRVERDDYSIDRVFFEAYPGHYVTGNLYLPKPQPAQMPGILCPHGHWPNGRFMDLGTGSAEVQQQLASGAERFECGARSPLQARCVQLARMGCAVFHYDMLGGYADSVQIPEHRTGLREHLNGKEPGSYGLFSAAAEARLQTSFGIQMWQNIRALDFMLTLPGIDSKRIAVTGASGGGTQSGGSAYRCGLSVCDGLYRDAGRVHLRKCSSPPHRHGQYRHRGCHGTTPARSHLGG
jgi:hypothetical protein